MVNVPKFFLGAMLHTRLNITRIKLICKSLIYAGGALKFLEQSPNYAGVLDEIVYFFQSAVGGSRSRMESRLFRFLEVPITVDTLISTEPTFTLFPQT